MAEESQAESRIWRAIEEHRARALHQLDSVAANSLGDLFGRLPRAPCCESTHELAKSLARDLTALGLIVHDSSASVPTGGVWLAPCPERAGVIVSWTQHDASAAVLGPKLHCELQETMNFDLCGVLRLLGYTVTRYDGGAAHLVLV